MTKEERKAQQIKLMKDFFAFKVNVFPIIVKIIFALGTVGCFLGGLFTVFNGIEGKQGGIVLLGIVISLLGPIILHIGFELILLFFSMLDMLREIRNNIFEIRDKISADKE